MPRRQAGGDNEARASSLLHYLAVYLFGAVKLFAILDRLTVRSAGIGMVFRVACPVIRCTMYCMEFVPSHHSQYLT